MTATPTPGDPHGGLTVVVPVRDGRTTLGPCLDALLAASVPAARILVVDDGSRDGSAGEAHSRGVRVLSLPEPSGAPAARNAGAQAAEGDILLFLDADVLIPSEAPSIALGCLEAESPTVAIQGTYSICHPNHDLPSLYKNTWIAHSFETSPREIGSTFSCFLMIRRDTFLEAGGYDPRCDSAGATDDFELGDRLVRSGVRIVNHPDLRVVHLKRYSLVSLLRNQFRRSRALVRLALERGFVPGVVARRRYGNLGGGFLLRCLLAPALAASVPAAALGCWVPVAVLGALELILAAPFLRFAARAVGLRRVLPFAALGTLDALVCAAGAAAGGLAWLQGRGALASTMRSRAASSRGRRRGL